MRYSEDAGTSRRQVAKIRAEAEKAKVEVEKELALKELELKVQAQASTSAAADTPCCNRDAKSPKLPAFIDEKDELDRLRLEG